MSIKLMGLVWDVEWPTQSQLVIALKLADYANDDGEKVYPARETLAKKAHCSETTVKATLKAFRACGILHTVHEGGKGPKDTTVYRLNVPLLKALADGHVTISGCSETLEINGDFPEVIEFEKGSEKGSEKGANTDPIEMKRGQSGAPRGQSDRKKGVTGRPQSTNIEPPIRTFSAHERASDEGARAPSAESASVGHYRPWFTVTTADHSWTSWIEHMIGLGREDLAEAAAKAGEISTRSRWPKEGSAELPRISSQAMAAVGAERIVGGE